jgi:hypothetical protein
MLAAMDPADHFLLEWTYSPPDFLEAPVVSTGPGYHLRVEGGCATARIEPSAYPEDHSLRNELHHTLNARFLGAQVLSHRGFTLTNASVTRVHPDGREDAWAFVEGITMRITVAGRLDAVLRDGDGNIIRDTKAERITKTEELMQLAAKHSPTNETALAILRSYSAAVNDPKNEFVHLYEVVDALRAEFGGKAAAQAALGVGDSWDRLHKIANDEPFNQGRHRGSMAGKLQDAKAEVLEEARSITRDLIERYLRLIDSP